MGDTVRDQSRFVRYFARLVLPCYRLPPVLQHQSIVVVFGGNVYRCARERGLASDIRGYVIGQPGIHDGAQGGVRGVVLLWGGLQRHGTLLTGTDRG